jgi:alginate O-acetyltransferase complex protein AlgI
MLFNSFGFLFVFLPIVVGAFFALREQRLRLVLLVVASYVFYAYADVWFAALMAASTAISFSGGLLVNSAASPRRRRLVLAAGISGTLALLVYFKYAEFAGGHAVDFFELVTGSHFPGLHRFLHGIVLPIGISFYTFEGISYQVDVYRGDQQPERNLLRYALFISFFPHLIAGPIVRYGKLAPQLGRLARFDPDVVRASLMLFALGLGKKVLIADGIARLVDPMLQRPGELGFFEAWAAMLGFAFQIYFDFSGYSDMALGLAGIFGIQLPWNFDRPYRSASPREFWRRWHVTLSTWLRDYLYIPLGGNRRGGRRRDLNLLTTMVLGGLWHGASLNFVAWGAYQGTLLVGQHHAGRLWPWRIPRALAVAFTFLLVTLGWVLFRMRSAAGIGDVYAAMAGAHGIGQFPGHLVLYILLGTAITWAWPEEWRLRLGEWGTPRVAAVASLGACAVVSLYATHAFLYFKF